MSHITKWLKHQYELIVKDNVYDAEVDSWFLMDNPKPVIIIITLYLLFVLKAGPQMMENRKPFALKSILLFYNLAISLFNGYMFSTFFVAAGYPIRYLCMPHPNKNSLPVTRIMYRSCWFFFISKIIELLDTVFFVLRKKRSQVTVLHVYHHSFMVLNTWLYLKYLKSEQGIVVGLINTFVHIFMYMYYFLAALGPDIQKYLWWKRYITVIQLDSTTFSVSLRDEDVSHYLNTIPGQFGIILTYLSLLLVIDCKVHRGLSIYMSTHTIIFIAMFLNFYRKAYQNKKGKSINLAGVVEISSDDYSRAKYD